MALSLPIQHCDYSYFAHSYTFPRSVVCLSVCLSVRLSVWTLEADLERLNDGLASHKVKDDGGSLCMKRLRSSPGLARYD